MNVNNPRCRRLAGIAAAAVLTGAVTACGGSITPAGDQTPIPGISDELIEAARQEGGVVLAAGGHTRDQLDLLESNFESRYGVSLTFNRADSGSTVNAVNSELASGKLNADVVSLADAKAMQTWANNGVLTPVTIPNQDQITDGLDTADSPQVPFAVVPLGIMYNSANTDESEVPSTWGDFAGSDQIAVTADPRASGSALAFYTVMSEDLGQDWAAQFGARRPIVTESTLGLNQLVLTGEADLGLPALESTVLTSANEGEPLSIAYPDGPVPATTLTVAALAGAPHPKAAELLLRYQLSDEFQKALGDNGTRGVLEGLPAPVGAPELDPDRIRTVLADELIVRGDTVRAEFATKVADR
ncbi:ABC transporter substrate-binding protein [Rhodococcus koreensis]